MSVAVSFLRRRPKASDYVIVQNRCWLYPELDQLYDTVGDT
ncbi:MAG: hypothetical protein QG608_2187, partial [Actinomycetota bacterium]|nr:hypothetical protein [Actinomycetota bacterium]